jgi:hypothetical protein
VRAGSAHNMEDDTGERQRCVLLEGRGGRGRESGEGVCVCVCVCVRACLVPEGRQRGLLWRV